MSLNDEHVRTGRWLFLWRSYLPLVFLVLLCMPMARFTYFGGTHALDNVWDAVCVSVSYLGLLVRVKTVGHAPHGTSGRNTRSQIADVMNTTGMYSIVRHPLYLGNFLMWFGVALFPHSLSLLLIFSLAFLVYYERIAFAEEDFLRLRFGPAFEAWAAVTPAFFPALRQWRRPDLPFSWRTVCKREYSGVMALALLFTSLELIGHFVAEGSFALEPGWAIFLAASTAVYATLRTLKKHTRVLHVSGR